MANVKQCDKCKKIISQECRLFLVGSYSDANGAQYRSSIEIDLCEKCSKEFLISVGKFKEEQE